MSRLTSSGSGSGEPARSPRRAGDPGRRGRPPPCFLGGRTGTSPMNRRTPREHPDMTTIATTNPATGDVEKTFDELADEEIDRRIGRAAETFAAYRTADVGRRAEWMNAAGRILDDE